MRRHFQTPQNRSPLRSALAALVLPLALAASTSLIGCGDDSGVTTTPPDRTDAGCLRPEEPVSYEIYFVVDVSGSMAPFLTNVKDALVAFADGFPEENADGRRVRVDYYVIGFVNDVKQFGAGRMTSVIAVQDAIQEAIEAGKTGNNLNNETFNAEREENLLDAVAYALDLNPTAEARIVLLATDAPFVESPSRLNGNITVQSTYEAIRSRLEEDEIRVHAFTEANQPGFFLPYRDMEPLTSLPGSQAYTLDEVNMGVEAVKDTLFRIAMDAACN